jgi:hypothetical protein
VAGGREVFAEEGVGNLRQDASAIAGAGIGANASAMSEIDEASQGALDDLARGAAGDVDNETDATRVVFERRVPERSATVGKAGGCVHDLDSPAGVHVIDPARNGASRAGREGDSAPTRNQFRTSTPAWTSSVAVSS